MKRLIFTVLCMLLLCSTAFAECALPALEEYMMPTEDAIEGLTFEPLLESPDAVSSIRTFAIAADGRVAVWSSSSSARARVGRLLVLDANGEKQSEYVFDYAQGNGRRKILFYAEDGRLCLASGTRTGSSRVFVLNTESGLVEEFYQIPSLESLAAYACMRSDAFRATYGNIIDDSSTFSYSERYDSIYELAGHTNSTITVKRRDGGETFTIYDETEKVERYENGRSKFIFVFLIPAALLIALMQWGYVWIRKRNGEPVFRTFRKHKDAQ